MNAVRFTLSAAIAAIAITSTARAQNIFDDFSSGNDNAWTRIDAPAMFLGIPSTYTVENGGYRFRGPVYPNVGMNLPTASVRLDSAASDAQISVDVVNWDHTMTQTASIAARLQQLSPTSFQFYSLTLFPRSVAAPGVSNFRIDRWNPDGVVDNLTANLLFPQVDPGHDFRMVFTIEGTSLRGDLFNLTLNPLVPFHTISVIDAGPSAITGAGVAGLFTTPNPPDLQASTFGPADMTFDNFRVVPAPGAAALLALAGVWAGQRRRS